MTRMCIFNSCQGQLSQCILFILCCGFQASACQFQNGSLPLEAQTYMSVGETLGPELGGAFTLFRGSSWSSSSGLSSHSSSSFSTRERKGSPSCFANDLVWLCAEWKDEALEQIDLDAWIHLPEDASCSKEILAGNLLLISQAFKPAAFVKMSIECRCQAPEAPEAG